MRHPFIPLEKKLIRTFESLNTEALAADLADGEWTKLLKRKLGSLASEQGYITSTSGVDGRFFGEWLFDLIWYADDSDGHLVELKLVLESEWRTWDAIWYDFEKLLVAKCEHKVMVFQASDKHFATYIDGMTSAIDRFYPSVPNERYLFAGWNKTTSEFEFYLKVSS